MADRNVEIVRALQPSEIDLVSAVRGPENPFPQLPPASFAEDFASEWIGPSGLKLGPFRGVEGIAAGWRDWLEAFETYEVRAEEFIGLGDQVLVFVRVRARTVRDGVEMEHAPAAVWTLRDGLVTRIVLYLDRDEALAAVGRR